MNRDRAATPGTARDAAAPPGESRARLFIACWPPAQVRDAIERAVGLWGALPGVALDPCDWHLTLAFLGERSLERVPGLQQLLRSLEWPRITVELNRIGVFEGARVLWIGTAETPPALTAARAGLLEALEHLDLLPPDPARFALHITLARRLCETAPPTAQLSEAITWPLGAPRLARSNRGQGRLRYSLFDGA